MKKIILGANLIKKHKEKPTISSILIFVLLAIYTLVLFVPIIWSIYASLADDYMFSIVFNSQFPNLKEKLPLGFENFKFAFEELTITTSAPGKDTYVFDVFGLMQNSIIYALTSSLSFTICPVIVAYVTARFKYAFSKIVYAFVVVAMSLPIVGAMASEIRMLHNLGVYDTVFSMIILRFNFLSIYYLILHAQFSSIPKDYRESAKIDGASNFRIMFQVVLPQALNTIVTVFILSFVTYWNDYQIPLLYLPSYPTAAYGIYDFVYNATADKATVPHQMAVTIMLTLPIVIVFIALNKRMRLSVAMGGIKS